MFDKHLYRLRHLRLASLTEGITLLLLLLIAVPLKWLADFPLAVAIVGPLHGVSFLIYGAMVLWALIWRRVTLIEATQLGAAAFIPFGAFMVDSLFRRKASVINLTK